MGGVEKGYVFIMEGDTEKEFYKILLEHLSRKYNATLVREELAAGTDIGYILYIGDESRLIKFHLVNAISQIPRSGRWFETQCVQKYAPTEWCVFLCYDTDGYKEDITKFHEGDWAILRSSLKNAVAVVDLAAAADIEDVMLVDIEHVCAFLNCDIPSNIRGRKGKAKMKNLFRANGTCYHEGTRASNLIKSLDMAYLLEHSPIPLREVEHLVFH